MAFDDRKSDATETISASVPSDLVAGVRKLVGKRGFSQFVTRALKKEVLRQNRLAFLAEYEKHAGPVDQAEVERIRQFMRSR
jgi:predicted GTPase